MVIDFEQAARQAQVDPALVKEFFDGAVKLEDPFFVQRLSADIRAKINLEGAIKLAVNRENGRMGYQLARAFMHDDGTPEKSDHAINLGKKVAAFADERRQEIWERAAGHIDAFCMHVSLPTLKVEFRADGTMTDTLSPADKATFMQLFKTRHPIVEAAFEAQRLEVEKNPIPERPQWLKDDPIWELTADLDKISLLQREEYKAYRTLQEQSFAAGMSAHRLLEPVRKGWNLENKAYDFLSIEDPEQRSHYDAERTYHLPRKEAGRELGHQ